MNHLPMDYCRCHDEKCPQNNLCMRYLDRRSPGGWTAHAQTLRNNAIVNGEIISECKHFLKAD